MQNEFFRKIDKKILYELLMVSLAIFSVATLWHKSAFNPLITWGIWALFFLDFSARLYRSEDKWGFIKTNPFLVIAVIPLDAIFQLARFARIIHLFRLKVITKHFTKPILRKLKKRRLTFLFPLTFLLVFLSVIPLYYLEPDIGTFKTAFLSSIMSLVFFGNSNIEPVTIAGKSILILLTVFGVMLHGLIISAAFSIATSYWHRRKEAPPEI